jgi:hypothetical protein
VAGPAKTVKTVKTTKTAPIMGDLEKTRLNSLIPHPSDFAHVSKTHGQAHVGRVMIHAFRLIDQTGLHDEASRLWGAVYLHDLARTHDGFDEVHGMHAVMRVNESTDLQERLIARGVQSDDPSMLLAVMMHCLPDDHSVYGGKPIWPFLQLLKDVDALDRVRFGDLDPSYLRHEATRGMVKFAEDLYSQSHRRVKEGQNYFSDLLKVAEKILGKPVPIPPSVLGQVVRAKAREKKGAATGKPGGAAAGKLAGAPAGKLAGAASGKVVGATPGKAAPSAAGKPAPTAAGKPAPTAGKLTGVPGPRAAGATAGKPAGSSVAPSVAKSAAPVAKLTKRKK